MASSLRFARRYGNPLPYVTVCLTYATVWCQVARMAQARKRQAKDKIARLDADAWIAAAFDALAEGGIDAVRVEPLAKSLAITKGSFYWHFADRRALIDAMLAAWTEGRIAAIRQQAAERGAARRGAARPRRSLHAPRQCARARDRACDPLARAHRRGRPRKPCASVDRERLRACGRAVRRARLAARRSAGARDPVLQLSVRAEPARREAVPPAARDRAIEALIAAP